jgi:hypothetical protein
MILLFDSLRLKQRRDNRAEFDKAIEALKADVKAFQMEAKEKLAAAIQKNCSEVVARLLPVVKIAPPERWHASLGTSPSGDMKPPRFRGCRPHACLRRSVRIH